jgi:SAM-dependent methyltransferase
MTAPTVADHYAPGDLTDTVLGALRAAGKDVDHLTVADLAPLDQYHIGGIGTTRDLARLAGIGAGMRVLDVGGGIGGPARLLADEYGAKVTVLDLTAEYCRVGAMLTARTGLTEQVSFRQGDALDLPFEDGQFDLVWTQHSSMNIEDKGRLYDEIFRVLRPGGRLALLEAMAGPNQPVQFPVPWASNPAFSFLQPPAAIGDILTATGFQVIAWNDLTDTIRRAAPPPAPGSAAAPPPLGIHLLVGPEFPTMARNYARNCAEGRVVVIQGILDRA